MSTWKEPDDFDRCTATSKQAGRRCIRYKSPGHEVCYFHGAASPQAKAKADEQLALAADRAIEVLADEMESASNPRDRIRAAMGILDRAGFAVLRRIEITDAEVRAEIARLEAELEDV